MGATLAVAWQVMTFPQTTVVLYGDSGIGKEVLARARAIHRAPGNATKLVVVLVADMFRADYLNRYAANFGAGGFKRLIGTGAVWLGTLHLHARLLDRACAKRCHFRGVLKELVAHLNRKSRRLGELVRSREKQLKMSQF